MGLTAYNAYTKQKVNEKQIPLGVYSLSSVKKDFSST